MFRIFMVLDDAVVIVALEMVVGEVGRGGDVGGGGRGGAQGYVVVVCCLAASLYF